MLKLLFLFFGISSLAFSQNTSLTVTVTGIKNNTGKLTAEVYNSKGKFLKSAFKTTSSTIKSNTVTLIFSDLPKSEYTVMVYHDENNNGKLDKKTLSECQKKP